MLHCFAAHSPSNQQHAALSTSLNMMKSEPLHIKQISGLVCTCPKALLMSANEVIPQLA